MVIILSDDLIRQRESEKEFSNFFSNIMTAYREGKHIIIISPKYVKILLQDELVKQEAKIILKHYLNHNKSIINILDYVKVVIYVVPSSIELTRYSSIKSKIEFRCIYLSELLDSATIQKSIILGENGKDSDLYSFFAEYYRLKKNLDHLVIKYKPQTGGGSTIEKEYETIYRNKEEFCICLVDSDKRAPHKQIGDTARKVLKINVKMEKENFNMKCHLLILNTLMAENLLPDTFYKTAYKADVLKKKIISSLNILEKDDCNIKHYFNYKKGIECITSCDDCKSEIKYYLCPLVKKHNFLLKDNKFIPGFGNKVLEDFIDYEDKYIEIDKDERVQSHWIKIGAIVASFTLTCPAIRVM
jgi:hypothetical protein